MGITVNDSQIFDNAGPGTAITIPSGTTIYGASYNSLPYSSGEIINVTFFSNSTRTALTNTTSMTLWSAGNVTKRIANSSLHIQGQLVFGYGSSYNMGYWWQIGSSGLRRDSIFQRHWASDTVHDNACKLGWHINGVYNTTATGALAVSVGWASVNGGSDYPGNWNPNSADAAAGSQTSSSLIIYEVAN